MFFPSPCPAELCLRPHRDDYDDTMLVVNTNEGKRREIWRLSNRWTSEVQRFNGRQNVDCGPYLALIGRRRGLPLPLYQKRQAKRRQFDGDDDAPFEPNSPYKRRQIAPPNRRSTVKSSVRRLSQRGPKRSFISPNLIDHGPVLVPSPFHGTAESLEQPMHSKNRVTRAVYSFEQTFTLIILFLMRRIWCVQFERAPVLGPS